MTFTNPQQAAAVLRAQISKLETKILIYAAQRDKLLVQLKHVEKMIEVSKNGKNK